MKKRVVCENCGTTLEYNDRSVCEGNRDREEIYCPVCKTVVDTVFTDQIPNVHIVKE